MADLAKIEQHLTSRSYIDGYAPSSADVQVYESLNGTAPDKAQYPHAARWFRHIASYAAEHSSLPAGQNLFASTSAAATSADKAAPAAEDEDDDIDLFGSDDEVDEEAEKLKQERVAKYNEQKKAKDDAKLAAGKELAVAKSVVTLQVKPWDDETDMEALEKVVRDIEMDGLVWGASKLVPVGYGIKMLQINLVVEDAKVSLEDLSERITEEGEEYVQSTDVAAMQKL